MNAFDYNLLLFLNRLADSSPLLTQIIIGIYSTSLKTLFLLALLWWAWFDREGQARQQEDRERIAACLVGSLFCIAGLRLAAALLPFRLRPIVNPDLGLHFPVNAEGWINWSSFPSDNAAMFAILATCLFTISRFMGYIAVLDVVFLICFPRVFLGIHYPTDVLFGALIGVLAGWFISHEKVRGVLSKPAFALMRYNAAAFYASAFVITFLFAETFWPFIDIVKKMVSLVKAFGSWG